MKIGKSGSSYLASLFLFSIALFLFFKAKVGTCYLTDCGIIYFTTATSKPAHLTPLTSSEAPLNTKLIFRELSY